ncbi:hypothetical protein BH23THE1_BH23THE1_22620 [soil metagenome]
MIKPPINFDMKRKYGLIVLMDSSVMSDLKCRVNEGV